MKTFKSMASQYVVSATIFDRSTFTMKEVTYTSVSKNDRLVKVGIAKEYNVKPSDVKITKIEAKTVVTTYKVDATLAEIIQACVDCGIEVSINTDNDDSTTDNDDSTTDSDDSTTDSDDENTNNA